MADDKNNDDAKSGKGKLIGGAVGGVVLLLAAYQFVLKPAPAPEALAMVEELPPAEGAIHELEEMVINLDGEGASYLRVGVAIVLTEEEDPALFAADEAIAKDVVIGYLGTLSADELEAGEPRAAVKDELGALMIEAYGEDRVVRVLFTALVTQ